jgi:ATP-dependent helicase/nuclease subunit B
MRKGTLTGARTHADLEAAFVRRLAGALADGRGPVWVLVPTNLVALHLRRRAARELGGVAGVEFLTLVDAARRMALCSLAAEGLAPLPPSAAELVLQGVLDGVPDGSYFAAFRRFRNASSALLGAVRLLAASRWTAPMLARAARQARFRDPAAARRLKELAALWAEFEGWKRAHRCFEEDDLILRASSPATAPAEVPAALLLYAFYDFTPAQQALARRLIDSAEAADAYLLYEQRDGAPAPGFEFAASTVEWLHEASGAERIEFVTPSEERTNLARLAEGLFADADLPSEAAARAYDGTVRVANCPGEGAEAEQVVREVLRAVREAAAPVRVGVLLRGAEGAAGLLAESLDRAGVDCYMREGLPLAQSVAGRIALALSSWGGGVASRAPVIEFLSLARVRWPEDLSATFLDRAARLAGITRGRDIWVERLRGRGALLRREAARAEGEDEAQRLQREAALCTAGAGFLEDFFHRTDIFAGSTWSDVAGRLGGLVREYAPAEDPATEAVLEVIEDLGRLDASGRPAEVETVRWVLGRSLAEASRRRGRFQHAGVTISSIMAARGAAFDVVIVPGLAEKGFPRHIPESSLVTELDREALNPLAAALGAGLLPLQQARPLEERYLFRIAVGSAARALVLTYARLEDGGGRPKMPSRFLTGACSTLAGRHVDAEALEGGRPEGLVERVPMASRGWSPERTALALDEEEYDRAVFTAPPAGKLSTAYMAAVSTSFRRALEMERARWGTDAFGPYDGKVRVAGPVQGAPLCGVTISPSRLETYARCPFEYFLKYVLGVTELEAPTEEFELPPMERGALLHDLLREVYIECLSARPFGEQSEEDVASALVRAGEVLDRLGRVHAENHPATWQAEREKTLEQLAALLGHERAEHAGARPARFEQSFGFGSPGHSLTLDSGEVLTFRGRIDRVDLLPDGTIQAVDYKSGKADAYKPDSLAGGTQLQLPIYLLAACQAMGAEAGRALYLSVAEAKDVPEFTSEQLAERMGDFRLALGLIVDGIASGNFFPLPADDRKSRDYCSKYCPASAACGSARTKLAEIKQSDPDLAGLRALREIG